MKRFLIKDGVRRESVEQAFGDLGWSRVDSDNTMPEVIAYKSSWVDASAEGVANYLENAPFDAAYVLASDASYSSLRAKFSDRGWVLNADDVLNHRWEGDQDALRTIGRLGLLAHGDFDPRIFSKLSALVLQPNATWQRYALYAMSNASWPHFGDVIRKAVDENLLDVALAGSAQALLADLEASHWNESLYRG